MAQCRICYEDGSLLNPLLSSCECKGSIQYSHRRCLMKWIKTTENESFHRLCEMCMTPYKFVSNSLVHSPHPAWAWRFFGNSTMVITWTYLLHVLVYVGAINHPRPSQMFILCRDTHTLFSAEILVLTAIYMGFYAPLVYNIKCKALYFFHWINPCPSNRRLRKKRPTLMLTLTMFSFLMSFYYIYGGGLIYIIMLPELYNVHKLIIKTIQANEFLEDE